MCKAPVHSTAKNPLSSESLSMQYCCNRSQVIWDYFLFSFEIAHYGKGLISIFQSIFVSINTFLFWLGEGGRGGEEADTRLSFYEV